MNRKDVIIVACLLNIALFMILFATATAWEEESQDDAPVPFDAPVEQVMIPEVAVPIEVIIPKQAPVDEIDEVVQEYTKRRDVVRRDVLLKQPEPAIVQPPTIPSKEIVVEVTVKKGDVLSKIAKFHGVSVDDILHVNGLASTKLKIGQVLKIKKTVPDKMAVTDAIAMSSESGQDVQGFYVVQGGDNPWKIARKCKIDYDELLRLNDLNEERAKNLKIGQKLRIK